MSHYSPQLPLGLSTDASSFGLGAVLFHIFPNGKERPVAYASRSLTSSEKNYSQIEKETLSFVFAVKKFYRYLYGRKFTWYTDHQPFEKLLAPTAPLPQTTSARIQRWAIFLMGFTYDVRFKKHGNVDGLSRLPLPTTSEETANIAGLEFVNDIDDFAAMAVVTSEKIQTATRSDPVAGRALRYTANGWPRSWNKDWNHTGISGSNYRRSMVALCGGAHVL